MINFWSFNIESTVDGRNPASVDIIDIPLFTGFQTCQVLQEFFHQTVRFCDRNIRSLFQLVLLDILILGLDSLSRPTSPTYSFWKSMAVISKVIVHIWTLWHGHFVVALQSLLTCDFVSFSIYENPMLNQQWSINFNREVQPTTVTSTCQNQTRIWNNQTLTLRWTQPTKPPQFSTTTKKMILSKYIPGKGI